MKVAVFDQILSPASPAGSCDARVVAALSDEHDVTVFTGEVQLAPSAAARVRHVGVAQVPGPGLASFLAYVTQASLAYVRHRARGAEYDVVQATDCDFLAADVCYSHLCHRAFLREVWPQIRAPIGPRTLNSWAIHRVKAAIEKRLVRVARVVVVPSEGLKRDLGRVYPGADDKTVVIQNTVDLDRHERPAGFDPAPWRQRMRTGDGNTAFLFVALGHFERKGLPLLFEALAQGHPDLAEARLWVVGGAPGLIQSYRKEAERLGIADQVTFAPRTDDVRPFLWAADALVAPSHYEAFSLGLLEAAAAALPLIATRISGTEELLDDGVNGLQVDRTAHGVGEGLRQFMRLDEAARTEMATSARASVEALGPERFAESWRRLYASLES